MLLVILVQYASVNFIKAHSESTSLPLPPCSTDLAFVPGALVETLRILLFHPRFRKTVTTAAPLISQAKVGVPFGGAVIIAPKLHNYAE